MAAGDTQRLERLRFLEGRRIAHEASQWQGPALVVAAQAFLLQVLTDPASAGRSPCR